MSLRNTITSYGSVAKFFHWLIAILLVCMLVFGYFLDAIPKDYQRSAYNIHKLTGLTIFALMIARGLWALINPKPVLPLDTPRWERYAEWCVHFFLYAAVMAMPLAGWIGSSAAGKAPHIGDVNLMLPVPASKSLTESAFATHGVLAIILIILISVHILAGLYHHFIKRDDVLRRMMPHGRHD